MALGAYSIIRYANDLNDQRINLGVLVWHPQDGSRHRLSPFLDRAQAVDPRVHTKDLKQQLAAIVEGFEAKSADTGKESLKRLSAMFRNGVEVTAPYPAEMFDIDSMLDRLYLQLVSPVDEIRRASSQKQFEKSLKAGLASAIKKMAPTLRLQEYGPRQLNGIAVNVGIRTASSQWQALWRAVSLQSEDRPDDQIAKAKAAALDIATIRTELTDFKRDQHYVALQAPKPKAAERLKESIAWLEHHADKVLVVEGGPSMSSSLEAVLTRVVPQQHKSSTRVRS